MLYKIPVTTLPNNTFNINVPVGDENLYFKLRFTYNSIAKYWMLSIFDADTLDCIISNLNMIETYGEYADLVKLFSYKHIGALYVVNVGSVNSSMPDDTNFGTDFELVWSDTAS